MMDQLVTWFTAVLGWCSRTDVPSVDEFQATDSAHQVTHAVDSGQTSQAMDSPEQESEASDEATESEASDSEAVDSGPTSQATDSAKTPDWYLDRATECMERVHQMTLESHSNKVKLNLSQWIKYLARELETAIEESRKSYTRSSSPEHQVVCLETLKLLNRLAVEIETFVKDCCKDEWMQTAITLASVPARVSSWGYYLKLCSVILRNSNELAAVWSSRTELESLIKLIMREAEVHVVEERASLADEATLLSILESLTLPSDSNTPGEFQLATILHRRLEAIQAMSTAGSPQPLNLELWEVDGGSLRRFKMLGKGASAKVHKAQWFGAVEVAEKVFDVPSDANFENEVFLLAKLSHPSIVSFLGYWADERSCSIVTELMDGDLHHLMRKLLKDDETRVAPFSIWEACDLMLQVAEGVHYMHQKDVVHRDLKSQNVLVRKSKDYDVVCAKVADFGLSKTKERSSYSRQTSNTGSSRSMAPELIQLLGHDSSKVKVSQSSCARVHPKTIDIYSYGMLCYEILTGDLPFSTIKSDREVKMKVLRGDRPVLPLECPKDLKRLIESCWDHEPNKRPSFPQICEELRHLKCSLLIDPLAAKKRYLDLATKCLQPVRQMISGSGSQTVKLNPSQCEYLAGKLETAVGTSREHYILLSSPHEHKLAEAVAYGRTLMLLCQLTIEVETFIKDCCEDKWMQTALTSAINSVPSRVSSWGYYLELCTLLNSRNSNNVGTDLLTQTELESLRKAEVHAVKERASRDEATLLNTLKSLILSSKSTTEETQLATILLERWESAASLSSQSSFKIDPRALEHMHKSLGRGSTSSLYKGIWVGEVVAIKTFYGGGNPDFLKEVSILAHLHHPNIVNMLGYVIEKRKCTIVMELMDQDLSSRMEQRLQDGSHDEAPFNIDEAMDLMLQVAEGVNYLHQLGIVHRDLRSANILVKHAKATKMKMVQEFLSVKVADFGLTKTKERNTTYSNQTLNVGTTRWMAPEIIHVNEYGQESKYYRTLRMPFKTDVYSFSMLCYEILTGNVPFSTARPNDVKRMVLSNERPELPHQCPPALKVLIQKCWHPEPNHRPSFTEICRELRYLKCISLLPEPSNELRTDPVAQPIAKALELTKAAQPAKALDLSGLSLIKIEYSCLHRGIQLGKGGTETTVYKAIYRPATDVLEDRVAQKYFLGAYNELDFKNEVTILADFKHSNIVSLVGYATDMIRSHCSIVMELMDRDLRDLMCRRMERNTTRTTGPFSIDVAVHIMLQIAQAMDYVHQKNVVHRDLKPHNILVKRANAKGQLDVKVADFGLSKKIKPGSNLRFNVGTLSWMAPEVIRLKKDEDLHMGTSNPEPFLYFSNALDITAMGITPFVWKKTKNYPDPFKSDIYSFGIVCFEILTGNAPTFHLKNRSAQTFSDEVFKKNPQKAAIFLLFLFLERLKFKDPQKAAVVLLLLLEGLSFKKDPQKAIVVLLLLHLKFKKDPIEVLKEKVRAGHRPLIPDYCPPKLKALIESCWDADASTRPSFAQIIVDLKHVLR